MNKKGLIRDVGDFDGKVKVIARITGLSDITTMI